MNSDATTRARALMAIFMPLISLSMSSMNYSTQENTINDTAADNRHNVTASKVRIPTFLMSINARTDRKVPHGGCDSGDSAVPE
jgi:hypothetical protein